MLETLVDKGAPPPRGSESQHCSLSKRCKDRDVSSASQCCTVVLSPNVLEAQGQRFKWISSKLQVERQTSDTQNAKGEKQSCLEGGS